MKRRRLDDELFAESDAACHNAVAEEVVDLSEVATAGVTDSQASDKREPTKRDMATQCRIKMPAFTPWKFRKAIHFYTGLESHNKLKTILLSLGPDQHALEYLHGIRPKLIVEDQFFPDACEAATI